MDAFEQIVSEILWMEGYWVRTSVKVELTKEDKRLIGLPSAPRWELDIVAYKGGENTLKVVECKSWIDSVGVRLSHFDGTNPEHANQFKLFNNATLRRVVFERLQQQFAASGACGPLPHIQLALAAGKVRNESDRGAIGEHFLVNQWEFWDEHWLRKRLQKMAERGYENQVSAVVAKLLERGRAAAAGTY